MPIKLDNRVSLAEAHHAIEASGKRLEAAMARSGSNARDAATLSKAEVKAEILDKAGSAGDFKALDAEVYDTAVKLAKSHGGQVGAAEIRQAVNAFKFGAKSASRGDGFIGKARDTGTDNLKAIYAAAQKHEAFAAINRASAQGPKEAPINQQQAPISQQQAPISQQQAPIGQQQSPISQQAPNIQQKG